VDRLICVCNFQQICSFLICANLQSQRCKFAFFARKLVKIRECTLGMQRNTGSLFTLPMPMQEEQQWMRHLTYLHHSLALVMLMPLEQCCDAVRHWSLRPREHRDSGECRIPLPDQSGGERQMTDQEGAGPRVVILKIPASFRGRKSKSAASKA